MGPLALYTAPLVRATAMPEATPHSHNVPSHTARLRLDTQRHSHSQHHAACAKLPHRMGVRLGNRGQSPTAPFPPRCWLPGARSCTNSLDGGRGRAGNGGRWLATVAGPCSRATVHNAAQRNRTARPAMAWQRTRAKSSSDGNAPTRSPVSAPAQRTRSGRIAGTQRKAFPYKHLRQLLSKLQELLSPQRCS